MTHIRLLAAGALIGAGALALLGCVPTDDVPAPPTTSVPAPTPAAAPETASVPITPPAPTPTPDPAPPTPEASIGTPVTIEAPVITEDDPRWDCRTMGNLQCGVEVNGTWYVITFADTQPVSVRVR